MFKYLIYLMVIISLFLGGAFYHWYNWQPVDSQIDIRGFLSQFWPDSEAPWLLKLEYDRRPLTILLIPGHDLDYLGAEYQDLTEAELNLALAKELYLFLDQDEKFRPTIARDPITGDYLEIIKKYWQDNEADILSHRQDLMALRSELLGRGDISDFSLKEDDPETQEISFRLYGLNKWARDHDFDLIIHLHFNDYFGRKKDDIGVFRGLSIYVPDGRFPNADISQVVAQSIFDSLTQLVPPSNLPFEAAGIIESEHLTAVAADPSPYAASILIEYGYIYEPPWAKPELRELILPELAQQTYRGLKDFFEPEAGFEKPKRLIGGEYQWTETLGPESQSKADILALKLFLQSEGLYPPLESDWSDCPLTGEYHNCLTQAVTYWQMGILEEIGYDSALTEELGIIGPAGLEWLNKNRADHEDRPGGEE